MWQKSNSDSKDIICFQINVCETFGGQKSC